MLETCGLFPIMYGAQVGIGYGNENNPLEQAVGLADGGYPT